MNNESLIFTGGERKDRQLLSSLAEAIESADRIELIVSFLMESGVRLLLPSLERAFERGAQITIITGLYLNLTSPSSLYMIRSSLKDNCNLRIYDDSSRSFHPKCYFITKNNKRSAYIGSSNVSSSALISGIEWNYKLTKEHDEKSLNELYEEFVDIRDNHSFALSDEFLTNYARTWHCPDIIKSLNISKSDKVEPRGAQIEALYALEKTRKDGFDKALISAATGIGKTYLAAFDSKNFKRVLFIAHRIEILKQVKDSFVAVRGNDSSYGFFTATDKDQDADVLFASVQTLSNSEYLSRKWFSPDCFDYIIVDEFHHAVASAYERVLSYFKPKFMLALTATPERYDGRDVYVLCNYNVPFSIDLGQAINRGLLVPFRYYGIYDMIDYSNVKIEHNHYSESELTQLYKTSIERKDLIYKNYLKHRKRYALAFCCSIKHAEDMAEYFFSRGIQCGVVCSESRGDLYLKRDDAIKKLRYRKIEIIFSVDIFNEGVDIPELDLVMFLRPTESPVVFLQQMGRGLRLSSEKDYLTILDFIGNYRNAGKIPSLIGTEVGELEELHSPESIYNAYRYPKGCIVDFELKLLDIFEEMRRNSLKSEDRILEDFKAQYENIKADKRVVTLIDLFSSIDMDVFLSAYSNKVLAGKKSFPKLLQKFLQFKGQMNDLNEEERTLIGTVGEEFLNKIASMNMEKSYKIPILLAFYNHGKIKRKITSDDVYISYKDFYLRDGNWKDLENGKSTASFRSWSKERYIREAKKNPISMLCRTDKFFYIPDEEDVLLAIDENVVPYFSNPMFVLHFKGILDARSALYYRANFISENNR